MRGARGWKWPGRYTRRGEDSRRSDRISTSCLKIFGRHVAEYEAADFLEAVEKDRDTWGEVEMPEELDAEPIENEALGR